MTWTTPRYSGSRRTRAGVALSENRETAEDLEVIDNWRSAHALPLQVIKMLLLKRAHRVSGDSLVAQRLKRLPSIRAKLQRETMRLQQMQDLGGCRAIMKSMDDLRALVTKFEEGFGKNPKRPGLQRHQLVDTKDYVAHPKQDGYRSVHYVLAYRTNLPHLKHFNGLLIEVQIRTRLQHAWATAIEIVDTFTGQSLKSALRTNIGDERWRRLFVLVSSAFAIRERSPEVPNSPERSADLKDELRELIRVTNVEDVLQGLGTALNVIQKDISQRARMYVLKLDTREKTIHVSPFVRSDEAQQQLFEEERQSANDPAIQVVQVSVDRVQALRTAYPNYYLDTSLFLNALGRALVP